MRPLAIETASRCTIPLSTIVPGAGGGGGGGGSSGNNIFKSYNNKCAESLTISAPTSSYNYRHKSKQLNYRVNAASGSSGSGYDDSDNSTRQLAVLLEVEGVLMDVYRFGNREAFNLAFKKMGLDCAHWTEPIYLDLIRKSFGGEEEMLTLYFNKIGWPTSLPTNEKGSFMKRVLREKKNALEDLVMSKSLPLRPGAEDFIDDAHKEGVPIVVLASYSRSGENIARPIIESLGKDRMSKIKIIGNMEVEQSLYGQLVLGKGVSSSLDEQLVSEARKAASTEKQKIAKEVASVLKLSVDIDTTSSESIQKIVTALRAGAEYAEVPVPNCVLVAGSLPGVAAAEQIGMPCVVLRSRLTSRAEFPSANAILDSFGPPDLTISRLRQLRSS
ncbi:CBBY-like protein [Cynara cardunculus var. scolymus]|uniref:HAD-like domain-containing protein n=1 Tax=Cynara cardunculus var. scolymus TaxID=59895 RepID=A0A103XJQ7_CYNCS|nr:CBBY-like protein [Cynara cardunculus var. scolymus]KVH92043.1 HAD-like domain-containing protein [Cynara cardunculus var. scolymus]